MENTKEKVVRFLLCMIRWGCRFNGQDNYEQVVQKKLKINDFNDLLKIRSCADLIEDTEFAIRHYCEYGLAKIEDNLETNENEIYLKLYGILNAVWLQKFAISGLVHLLLVNSKDANLKLLETHKIIELRNIAGSHTVNYRDFTNNDKLTFFRIVQTNLNPKGNNMEVISHNDEIKSFNLYELVLDYNELSERLLFEGVKDYYKKILPTGSKDLDKFIKENDLLTFKHFDYRSLYKNDIKRRGILKGVKK